MDKYDVNFKRLALLLLPTFWRRPLFAAMAYAAVSPLQYLHTRFILWKRESDYRLEHNGQVCYLRALLNDKFDPIDRRITITETVENVGFITLHKREEDAEVLGPAPRIGPDPDSQPPRLRRGERLRLLGEYPAGAL